MPSHLRRYAAVVRKTHSRHGASINHRPLTIEGNNAIIDGSLVRAAAILANGGGDLTVRHLTVRNAPDEGIDVEVPGTATGTIRVTLFHVEIANNGGLGVLVNDQVDQAAPEPPARPDSRGSAAAVQVKVHASRLFHNGYTVSDRDGLRVNEGGAGDLTIDITESAFEENAADGVEVDERGDGNVYVQMSGSLLRASISRKTMITAIPAISSGRSR